MYQVTHQPVLVSVVRIIKALREKGSISPSELIDTVDMPKKTFYRALNALKESGIVAPEDGRYYWYDFRETRAYKSSFEAEQALKHSEKIASGLKHLIGPGRTYYSEDELLPNPEYMEFALIHLRTAYNEFFKLFEKAESINRSANEKEQELLDEIKTKLQASSVETQYPKNIAKMILSDIKEILRGRKPYFLNDIRIQGKEVKSGSYTDLVKNKEMFESLKRFIIREEASKENRENCSKIVESENKYYTLRQKLESEIKILIMQVENGTPLLGNCQMCPKVEISS